MNPGPLDTHGPNPIQADEPAIRFDLFTVFPGMFQGPLDESILRRAAEKGLIYVQVHDIRDWTTDRHRTTDDTPYGGGAGMVMMAPPIISAVETTLGETLGQPGTRVLVMSAAGRLFTQRMAEDLATSTRLALICGHYEGIDERVATILNAEEISIGDYVLTGGELAAMVVVDAVSRLVPGVIAGHSTDEESYRTELLEYPQYTRPFSVRGHDVPAVLLSGHHAEIARWRREQALIRTARHRPDLIARVPLTDREQEIVANALPLQSEAEPGTAPVPTSAPRTGTSADSS